MSLNFTLQLIYQYSLHKLTEEQLKIQVLQINLAFAEVVFKPIVKCVFIVETETTGERKRF